jgi:hypothetical protein
MRERLTEEWRYEPTDSLLGIKWEWAVVFMLLLLYPSETATSVHSIVAE